MTYGRILAGVTAAAVALGGGVALAAAPKSTTIKQSTSFAFKPNRYIQDGLRWNKDVYHVRSGGTLHLKFTVKDEGQHTFTVLRKSQIPTTPETLFNCKACNRMIRAHGADPTDESKPPTFAYVQNGKGQNTPPKIDGPGDSAGIGFPGQPKTVDLKVTARKGTTLHFLCLVHPWMQATLKVG